MWQNVVNGILGIWVLALVFLPFSDSMHKVLLAVTGLAIAATAFFGRFIVRPAGDVVDVAVKQQKEKSENFNLEQNQL
jgi:hypothetical protein